MIQGTTPTLELVCELNWDNIEDLSVTFQQKNKNVLKLNKEDCNYENGAILILLTQEQTLLFKHKDLLEIQIKVKDFSEKVFASEIIRTSVSRILDEDAI